MEDIYKAYAEYGGQKVRNIEACRKICDILSDDGLIWLRHRKGLTIEFDQSKLRYLAPHARIISTASGVTHSSDENAVAAVLSEFSNLLSWQPPKTAYIHAVRSMGKSESIISPGVSDGQGLLRWIAQIQVAKWNAREDRVHFDNINRLIRDVTGVKDATIPVPNDLTIVQLEGNDKILPLDSWGTGIQQLILIACYCTMYSNQIIRIEEPEINLHPVLQRKLIRYLKNQTNNQYFISTHSASFMDTPEATIFHVSNDGHETQVSSATLNQHKYEICRDLGYRASDVMQANAIIWVEGPSDRLYVKHWIGHKANDLVEGIHFSIMFYGGRLLSHLSANDEDVSEFISLRSLNQNLAVVMDSDRKAADSGINGTKQRVINELGIAPGIAWLTEGREVENYIDPTLIEEALNNLYNDFEKIENEDKYAHILQYKSKSGKIKDKIDKIKVERAICEKPANLKLYDLDEKVQGLVDMIRRANI